MILLVSLKSIILPYSDYKTYVVRVVVVVVVLLINPVLASF